MVMAGGVQVLTSHAGVQCCQAHLPFLGGGGSGSARRLVIFANLAVAAQT